MYRPNRQNMNNPDINNQETESRKLRTNDILQLPTRSSQMIPFGISNG